MSPIAFRVARVVRLCLFLALAAGGTVFAAAAPAAPDASYKLSSDGPLPVSYTHLTLPTSDLV